MTSGNYIIGFQFLLFVLFLLVPGANADDDIGLVYKKTFDEVKSLLDSADSYQAIGYINNLGEPDSVAGIYSELVIDFYWKEKNLPDMIAIARAGIQYCLTKADELKLNDPILAKEIKRKARVISYNLASFTWPGWGEKGIVIGRSDIQVGLDAARLSLRLVKELHEDEDKLSAAYWVLGAQLMADQKYDEANSAFAQSKAHARFAGSRMNELLADGYIAINKIITGNEDGRNMLGAAVEELKGMNNEDANFYIEQFNTALNAFIK